MLMLIDDAHALIIITLHSRAMARVVKEYVAVQNRRYNYVDKCACVGIRWGTVLIHHALCFAGHISPST